MIQKITQDDFDEAYERVKNGDSYFVIPIYNSSMVIKDKSIIKWEKYGRPAIYKDKDGIGFRLSKGKSSSLYVFDLYESF